MLFFICQFFFRVPSILTCTVASPRHIHTSEVRLTDFDDLKNKAIKNKYETKKDFLEYNDIVYAPTKEGEDPRPAVSVHCSDAVFSSKRQLVIKKRPITSAPPNCI